jgi:hypothetical protein
MYRLCGDIILFFTKSFEKKLCCPKCFFLVEWLNWSAILVLFGVSMVKFCFGNRDFPRPL